MQTNLADWIRDTPDGIEADAILRSCVHCGFCTATCPTYQLLGDELDGPRGRIYLIKGALEGGEVTATTQLHLDRCLTCRNCETTCPSGVKYGRLVDIGRKVVDQRLDHIGRSAPVRALRWLLKEGLTSPLFAPAMKLGQAVRPMLPAALKSKVPPKTSAGVWPTRTHARKMLLLAGCVQPAMAPNINSATARVLDALGVEVVIAERAGCCGAIRHHLDDHGGALDDARRNIDAWWPAIESGAEAIVINASGCGPMVKDYAHLLRFDPLYADKAKRVSELAKDVAEVVPGLLGALPSPLARIRGRGAGGEGHATSLRAVFHPPCTLQHAQQIRGAVEAMLTSLGVELLPFAESHLCCGSAGTFSILHAELAYPLRDRKLGQLQAGKPDVILSANIGCITHLASGTGTPVRHWIEWLDQRLSA